MISRLHPSSVPRRARTSAVVVVVGLLATMMTTAAAPAGARSSAPGLDGAGLEGFWDAATGGAATGGAATGDAATGYAGPVAADPYATLDRVLVAKAPPDECYDGIGVDYPDGPPCASGAEKVNQAYVWGLTAGGDAGDLWFGTAPNVLCAVLGGFHGIVLPHETESWVCEFGESELARANPALPPAIGDWRMPRIYRYDPATGALEDKTPPDPRLLTTLGLRSAGALGDVAILGGPSLLGGIDLFAFDTATGSYLGSANLPAYSNIRKWIVVDGVLYAGVGTTTGGHVVRWNDDPAAAGYPFAFTVVGTMTGAAVELAVHEGRLFVTTWPIPVGTTGVIDEAGLWMSPALAPGGLTPADAAGWTKVWTTSDYEPDPLVAATTGGGALASFDGALYWGTMHVPFVSGLAHLGLYYPDPATPPTETEIVAGLLGTHRAVGVFRGHHFGDVTEEIELLYGEPYLPVYHPVDGWTVAPNAMLTFPAYGPSGFGSFFNNYTWTMDVYDGSLFVGSMDFSYLVDDLLTMVGEMLGVPSWDPAIELPPRSFGADLWRFDGSTAPAVPESLTGVGNHTNYGIRTMVHDGGFLYLGSANPMNLLTDPNDDLPEGGWELIRLGVHQPPAAMDDAYIVLEDVPLVVGGAGVLGNDTGDGLLATLVSGPSHGTLNLGADGGFSYLPDADYAGTDTFVYRAVDPVGATDDATVTFTVTGVNDAPVVLPDVAGVSQGATVDIPVLANDTDPDGDALVAEIVSGPSRGTATVGAGGTIGYTHGGSTFATDSFTYRVSDGAAWSAPATVTVNVTIVLPGVVARMDSVGLVDPATGRWHLAHDGGKVLAFFYGDPGDVPFVGDWDCDGVDTPGLYRRADGYVYLRDSNTQGIADRSFYFGNPDDVPIAGDFDGDGCDTVSVYRPATGQVFIMNELGKDGIGLGAADVAYYFGNPGDKPFTGDFDGDGIDTVGLHRESTGLVYFRNRHTQGIADASFVFGDPGDRLVAGDWTAKAKDTVGVYRPGNTTFYLRYANSAGSADEVLIFGETAWIPVAGWFGLD